MDEKELKALEALKFLNLERKNELQDALKKNNETIENLHALTGYESPQKKTNDMIEKMLKEHESSERLKLQESMEESIETIEKLQKLAGSVSMPSKSVPDLEKLKYSASLLLAQDILAPIRREFSNTTTPQIEDNKEDEKMTIKIDAITLKNFRFFTDTKENYENEEYKTFKPNGKNMLIYGENGSGKSSLYKAFEFLAKVGKEDISAEFKANRNIHISSGDMSSIDFEFNNGSSLGINDSSTQEIEMDFIKNLSTFTPMLDYHGLLKISYDEKNDIDKKMNLYNFFKIILKDYPIDSNQVLKDLRGDSYFSKFKDIIKNDLLGEVNSILAKFKQDFEITSVEFDSHNGEVFLNIKFFEKEDIKNYHQFLNEARLSALAISVYFSIIKIQFSKLKENALKILILDDLLISFDMNNRMSLLDILSEEFSDFQVFFFTHDKNLYDTFKSSKKIEWDAYEIYVDKHDDGYEMPFIKDYKTYHEKAINHFNDRDYSACSTYLRKEVELQCYDFLGFSSLEGVLGSVKIKDNYRKIETCFPILIGALRSFDNCKTILDEKLRAEKCLQFSEVVLKAVEAVKDIVKEDSFHDINNIKDRILNPQAHHDTSKPLYKKELEEAISMVKDFLVP